MTAEAADANDAELGKRGNPSLRTCIVSRDELPPSDLIRFVAGPDGVIVPDLARKLPGRGVWVRCSPVDVATAVTRKAFAKSLKRTVTASADLPVQIEVS